MIARDIRAKIRMISYWTKILNSSQDKFSLQIYSLILAQYHNKWIFNIKTILDNCGLSYIWLKQGMDINLTWLKTTLSNTLKDQFQQEWNEAVFYSSKCINYRTFKETFQYEAYLTNLPTKLRIYFTKFRCRSHRLPIEDGTFKGITKNLRLCTKCNTNQIGDEFHYIFHCPSFKSERSKFIPQKILDKPSTYTMSTLFNSKDKVLINLCKFIIIIMKNMK